MLILQLAIILVAAKIAGSLSVRLGQPSVLGKLLIGIVLGPSVLGLVNETETLAELSQIGVILLMFIAGLETDLDEFKQTGKSATFVGVGGIIVPTVILKKILFFAGAILVGWKAVPWFLNKFSSLKVTETVISSALIICFVYAYLAEYTGVAAIIGAYLAGVAISVTNFKHEVFEKVETISYSIFVPIFFTSIGVTAQFSGITQNLGLIVVLSIIAILTKLIGASVGAKLSGFNWNSSLGIGSAMVSRGEVALILAIIGLESKLLTQDMFAVLVVVILVTTIVTPPMMKLFFRNQIPS